MRLNVFRLQAWHLFVVLFFIPLVNNYLLGQRLPPPPLPAEYRNNLEVLSSYLSVIQPFLFALLGFPLLVSLCQWFYLRQVALTLVKLLPTDIDSQQRWLRINLLFIPVFTIIFFAVLYQFYSHPDWINIRPGEEPTPESVSFFGTVLLLFPFFIYLVFAYLWVLRNIVRALKTIELSRLARFADYFPEFLMLLFFPFGIWFLQPRFRNLYEQAVTAGRIEE